MAVKQVSADSAVAPNLVPMVDIMFLLLLFFMLGADMGQRELEEVKLPIADSVKEDKQELDATKPENQRLTINIYHDTQIKCKDYETEGGVCRDEAHWAIGIRGKDFKEHEALKLELQGLVEIYREKTGTQVGPVEPGKPRPACEMKVMIRGDGAALYSYVQRAMNACGDAGIYKIEIGAAQRNPD